MGFDEAATSTQPTGGARSIAAAKLVALITMAETTTSMDLRTYLNYVQDVGEFSDFFSIVYSGRLSSDLYELFVEIQDPSEWFHQKIKVVNFSGILVLCDFSGNP
ncbi:hypothetical protein V6N11_025612 [Hibiscus sabdariffa]|uniref:Uncharacterized protein n=1 Tax=Hibiscus sabdariffa TaxID=183260 RepID=A0ABR2ST46_9ROSI